MPIAEYIQKGVAVGAYADTIGWRHYGLVQLAQVLGYTATSHEGMGMDDLKDILTAGKLPIVSIRWVFKAPSLTNRLLLRHKRGGHLALVVGFEERGGEVEGLYVHHTSIRPEFNWEHKLIPRSKFVEGFTGRCVVVG